MAGRTYRYFIGTPLYPFGYGLSYTTFAYSDASLLGDILSVTVKNTGAMDGDEVVQAYIHADGSPEAAPNGKLCAFRRVPLKAGEAKTISLKLSEDAYTVVNAQGKRISGGTQYTLSVGGSQGDKQSAALTGSAPIKMKVIL